MRTSSTAGRSIRTLTPLDPLVLRISFRANAPVPSPIAGFLVRNNRGENIFGSNTARENFPLPPMTAGDADNDRFSLDDPRLWRRALYRISLAVSDGNVEEFAVCDYIEDALEIKTSAGSDLQALARLLSAPLRR